MKQFFYLLLAFFLGLFAERLYSMGNRSEKDSLILETKEARKELERESELLSEKIFG